MILNKKEILSGIFYKLSLILVFAVNTQVSAHSISQCQQLFLDKLLPGVASLVQKDAYAQWRLWEQLNTLPWGHESFQRTTEIVDVPLALIPLTDVKIQISADIPMSIASQFISNTHVYWPKHPDNVNKKIPFFDAPVVSYVLGHYSASRSIPLEHTLRGFSLKLPTSHPNGAHRGGGEGKINTYTDIKAGFLYSEHIREQDKLIGKDQRLTVLREVLTIEEKTYGNGALLRDIRLLDDGHYYLPGFAIPTVGREIAKLHGKQYEEFWEQHWVKTTAVAKAMLLLRYGLNSEMPHLQNVLVQLDRNLMPTGKVVFRDISDAYLVDTILEAYELQSMFGRAKNVYEEVSRSLQIRTGQTLHPLMEPTSKPKHPFSISQETFENWITLHEQVYTQYIYEQLGVLSEAPMNLSGLKLEQHIYNFLSSPEGQVALKKYRAKLLREQPVAPVSF